VSLCLTFFFLQEKIENKKVRVQDMYNVWKLKRQGQRKKKLSKYFYSIIFDFIFYYLLTLNVVLHKIIKNI